MAVPETVSFKNSCPGASVSRKTALEKSPETELAGMVTVSEVRVSPDLSIAKTYVSIFPSSKQEEAMKILNDNMGEIRGALGRQIGRQLRIVPEIVYYLDTTLDYAEHIEELLKK